MATINFLIQSTKSNLVPIYIRFRNGRQYDLKAKTKIFIDPLEWSAKKQGPIKPQKSHELVSVVQQMNQLKSDLMDYFHNSLRKGVAIDADWIKRFIEKGTTNPNELPDDLVGYFKYYLSIKESTIKKTTYKKILSFERLLTKFEEWSGKHYLLSELNHDFRIRLEEFGAKHSYSPRYILDVLNYIKVIARSADRNGINVNRQFEEFKIKRIKCDYITLNHQELLDIEKTEFSEDYLDNARDWLLISCDTAQRVSDFQTFDKSMIREVTNKTGKIVYLLQFIQEKTEKPMAILLSSRVLRILEKRSGNFPRAISDVKYNVYIKNVCERAGLSELVEGSKIVVNPKTKIKRKVKGLYPKFELVTSHIGRRSFVSNSRNIIPADLIRTQTGHSSERTLWEYDHKGVVDSALDLFDYLN